MQNPNSAKDRIKNHLAYKLGQAMINYECNGGGYRTLLKDLYKIFRQKLKEKRIYQQVIQAFPNLKYPELEQCSDYNEALRYKFHLSYLLGEALIKATKTWYKGGYFKLKEDIERAKKEFESFREFFKVKEFQRFHSNILVEILNHKALFIKEYSNIKALLKLHQDYEALLDTIFNNFNDFIQNFDCIKQWLCSDDFKERYKNEAHPYPSLFDPKKLNDKNERINYYNISAELAWNFNLPLPDNYEFVWIGGALSGHGAMRMYLELCGIHLLHCIHHDPSIIYSNIFIHLLNNPNSYNIIVYIDYTHVSVFRNDLARFLNLLNKNKPLLHLVRDPISKLKTGINHINFKTNKLDYFDLNTPVDRVLDRDEYYFGASKPTCEHIESYWIYQDAFFRMNFFEMILKPKDINYIDMDEIKPERITDTLKKLSTLYHFPKIPTKEIDSNPAYDALGVLFPVTLYAKDITEDENDDRGIEILITTKSLLKVYRIQNYKEINFILFEDKIAFENLIFCIPEGQFDLFMSNPKLIKQTQFYLKEFVSKLEIKMNQKKAHLMTEDSILEFFQRNKILRKKFKTLLDEETKHIKQHRPDIVASWKHYQEFEKMCKELDE